MCQLYVNKARKKQSGLCNLVMLALVLCLETSKLSPQLSWPQIGLGIALLWGKLRLRPPLKVVLGVGWELSYSNCGCDSPSWYVYDSSEGNPTCQCEPSRIRASPVLGGAGSRGEGEAGNLSGSSGAIPALERPRQHPRSRTFAVACGATHGEQDCHNLLLPYFRSVGHGRGTCITLRKM